MKKSKVADSTFRNPFSIRPALEFGVIFTVVLLLTRVAKHYAGYGGQMVVSAISGLVDVTAISMTLASFVQSGTSAARDAVIGLTLAHGSQRHLQVRRRPQQPSAGFLPAPDGGLRDHVRSRRRRDSHSRSGAHGCISKSSADRTDYSDFTGCRGHPCRRKRETHRGFHIRLVITSTPRRRAASPAPTDPRASSYRRASDRPTRSAAAGGA